MKIVNFLHFFKIMELKNIINQEKSIYNIFIEYIEDDSGAGIDFLDLMNHHISDKVKKGSSEFTKFLQLISKILKNHYRSADFDDKMERILLYLKNDIKHTFTNMELFNIFKSNKRILYILLKNEMLIIDEYISHYMLSKIEKKYPQYFFDEIRLFIHEEESRKINKEFAEYDQTFFNDYEEKHRQGYDDSFVCDLIRNDSVEDFISYVTRTNISVPHRKIKASFYETNSFLLKNEPSFIEYAAFYGSVQIFQYLKFNGAIFSPSLWIYAIHSKNPELIHMLEENNIEPNDDTYCECLLEAIKCHHNDIANYIQNNLLNYENNEQEIGEKIVDCCLRYHNYSFFPDYLNNFYVFYNLCKYKYYDLVNIYIEINKKDIESSTIHPYFFLLIKFHF